MQKEKEENTHKGPRGVSAGVLPSSSNARTGPEPPHKPWEARRREGRAEHFPGGGPEASATARDAAVRGTPGGTRTGQTGAAAPERGPAATTKAALLTPLPGAFVRAHCYSTSRQLLGNFWMCLLVPSIRSPTGDRCTDRRAKRRHSARPAGNRHGKCSEGASRPGLRGAGARVEGAAPWPSREWVLTHSHQAGAPHRAWLAGPCPPSDPCLCLP